MKKAILKRTADMLEKIGIGSMLVGLFQTQQTGLIIGAAWLPATYLPHGRQKNERMDNFQHYLPVYHWCRPLGWIEQAQTALGTQ